MKQFRVIENGRVVWVQHFGKRVKNYIVTNSFYDYARNQFYFEGLLEVIGTIIEDVDLVLKVTKDGATMTLSLTRDQLPLAEDIKLALLRAFPEDIEQVSLIENELHILDFFQHRE